MKTLFLISALVLSVTLPARAQTGGANVPPRAGNHLIVFYSWSGNSRSIAADLQSLVGGAIVEITPAAPYTHHYNQMLDAAKQEIAAIDNGGKYPAVNSPANNLAGYDTVFIIYPLWWSRMATPMQAFLHGQSGQLRGKTLALICTSGSSGIAQSVADARRLCPESTFTEALQIRASAVSGAKNLLGAWLKKTGFN